MGYRYKIHDSNDRVVKESGNYKTVKQARAAGHKDLYKSDYPQGSQSVVDATPKKSREPSFSLFSSKKGFSI